MLGWYTRVAKLTLGGSKGYLGVKGLGGQRVGGCARAPWRMLRGGHVQLPAANFELPPAAQRPTCSAAAACSASKLVDGRALGFAHLSGTSTLSLNTPASYTLPAGPCSCADKRVMLLPSGQTHTPSGGFLRSIFNSLDIRFCSAMAVSPQRGASAPRSALKAGPFKRVWGAIDVRASHEAACACSRP